MNTLADTAHRAFHLDGQIVIVMESGVELRFPVAKNPRLTRGTPAQLDHIELSPLGLHWPDLARQAQTGCHRPPRRSRC